MNRSKKRKINKCVTSTGRRPPAETEELRLGALPSGIPRVLDPDSPLARILESGAISSVQSGAPDNWLELIGAWTGLFPPANVVMAAERLAQCAQPDWNGVLDLNGLGLGDRFPIDLIAKLNNVPALLAMGNLLTRFEATKLQGMQMRVLHLAYNRLTKFEGDTLIHLQELRV